MSQVELKPYMAATNTKFSLLFETLILQHFWSDKPVCSAAVKQRKEKNEKFNFARSYLRQRINKEVSAGASNFPHSARAEKSPI